MKRIIIFFSLVLCILSLKAQSRSEIALVLKNDKAELLSDVLVELLPLGRKSMSDERGKVFFHALPQGQYILNIKHLGYHNLRDTIELGTKKVFKYLHLKEDSKSLTESFVFSEQKRIKSLKSSLPLSQVDAAFILENQAGTLMKSLEKLAGISSIEIGAGAAKPLIRGLGFNRVIVAEDGIKHEGQQWGADHGLEIDRFSVQNVEIIKGPAALNFGADAIAGVISLSRAPFPAMNTARTEISSSYMSNNNYSSLAFLTERRASQLYFHLATSLVNYSDYRVPSNFVNIYSYKVPLYKNYLRNTAGREFNIQLKTAYISSDFHTILSISNYYSHSGFFANAHGLEPQKVDNALFDKSAFDIMLPDARVNHLKISTETYLKRDRHRLKFILSYQKNFRQERGHYVSHGYMPLSLDKNLFPENLERGFDKDYYTLKLEDIYNYANLELSMGVEAAYQNNKISGWDFILPSFQQYNLSAYAIASHRLNSHNRLNYGLRAELAQLHIQEYKDWFYSEYRDKSPQKLIRATQTDKSYKDIVFSLGWVYNNEPFTLKSNIGKGFRIPIAMELASNGVNYHYFRYEVGNPALSAEHSYQFDLDMELKKNIWSLSFSPFINYFPNYIYLNPTSSFDVLYGAGNQIFRYVQSEVFRYGAELNLSIHLFDVLKISSINEYIKSIQLSGDKRAYGLPFSPPFSSTLQLRYELPCFLGLHSPYLEADYTYCHKQEDIVPPEEKSPAYSLVALSCGTDLKFERYKIKLNMNINNLFNTKYYKHTNFYRLINLPEQGRNISIIAKFSF